MPLLPGKKNIGKNMETEMASGKKKSQAIAIALNVARKASGGAVGYAEGGAPDEARMKRQIAERAMRGMDPTPEQQAYLASVLPEKEARSSALGDTALELTGVPGMVRGSSNVARGIAEGDPIRGAGGLLEAGISAVPYAGALGRIPMAVARQAFATVPRTAAVLGTAGALNSYSDDALAAQKNAAQAIAEDPEVKALEVRRREALKDIERINAQHARSGKQTQIEALKPYQKIFDDINEKITKAEDRARQRFMDQATFREKYPGLPGAMFGAGLGVAGGLPLLKGVLERASDRFTRRPGIEKAAENVSNAFAGGLSDAETAAAQTILRNKLASWDRGHSGLGAASKYVGAIGTGALTGAEASQLPEQIDYITNEPGHPAREKAVAAFQNPDYWKERIGPAALGAGAGLFGSKLPNLAPKNTEFLAAARELADRGRPPSAMQQIMGIFSRKGPQGPTEAALADVRRYRNAVGPAPEPPSAQPAPPSNPATSLEGRLGIPQETVSLGPMPTFSPKTSLEIQPGSGAVFSKFEPAAPTKAQGPALPTEAPSNPPVASSPPKTFPGSDIPLPPGVSINSRGIPYDVHTGHTLKKRLYTPKEGSAKSPDVPEKKYGGAVDAAMRIARAMGGRVHTGPITQRADGGRTDTVPMDVPEGAYVIPADIVSALGQGDTTAGMKSIGGMFGPHDEPGAKQSVPILAAGGEYVMSPSQVARLANGDLAKAHAMLDQWVKATRAKNIETLANLPGPQR